MAKTEKTVSWESLVDVISANSGMPKKQIDDTSKHIVKGIRGQTAKEGWRCSSCRNSI